MQELAQVGTTYTYLWCTCPTPGCAPPVLRVQWLLTESVERALLLFLNFDLSIPGVHMEQEPLGSGP